MKESRPAIINDLIERLSELPGIGRKTAERFVYYLVNQPESKLSALAENISSLPKEVKKCETCGRIAEKSPCFFCSDKNRRNDIICVVAESQDIAPIENTGKYDGRYHILGGVINALEGITPDKLSINNLIERIQANGFKEVILALNPNMEGESTVLHISKLLKDKNIKITRLARGLPIGSDLAYADEITLSNALQDRQEVK